MADAARRHPAARVFGTLTAYHLGLAFGQPASQLGPVKGGEVLDFAGYTVEVIAALHSRNGAYSMASPGLRVAVPDKPVAVPDKPPTIADLFRAAVRKTAPRTRMSLPDYLTPYTFA
jgi:hypothetical protein